MCSKRLSNCGFDRVCMRDRNDGLSGMLRDETIDCTHHARLHFGERFTGGESKTTWIPLDGGPFGEFAKCIKLLACPVTEVAFEEPSVDLHFEFASTGNGCGGLTGSFEWRGVDRGDLGEFRDSLSGGLGLGCAGIGEMKALRSSGKRRAGRGCLAVSNEQDQGGGGGGALASHEIQSLPRDSFDPTGWRSSQG